MDRYYIGIDPGLTGYLAILSPKSTLTPETHAMPTTLNRKGNKALDIPETFRVLKSMTDGREAVAVIEEQIPFPRQAVQSVATIAEQQGVLRACCAALGIPVRMVRPAEWKKAMGVMLTAPTKREGPEDDKQRARRLSKGKKARKGASISAAKSLFPNVTIRTKDDGLAEALLLACHAEILYGGKD